MCGIGGVWMFNDKKIDEVLSENVVKLHSELISRGTDAFGYYARNEEKSELFKLPCDAKTFYDQINVRIPRNEYFVGYDFVGLHTRLSTQGDPNNNVNNHPFKLKNVVGAHNGYLLIDLPIEITKNEPETDSYQIFKLIDLKVEKSKDVDDLAETVANELEIVSEYGYFAIWVYDKRFDVLILARDNDKPLYYAMNSDYLVFASEPHYIIRAFDRKAFKRIYGLKSATVHVFSRDGLETKAKFVLNKPENHYDIKYDYVYNYYGEKRKNKAKSFWLW